MSRCPAAREYGQTTIRQCQVVADTIIPELYALPSIDANARQFNHNANRRHNRYNRYNPILTAKEFCVFQFRKSGAKLLKLFDFKISEIINNLLSHR